MAFERPALFRELELDIEGEGQLLLDFSTDQPGAAMAVRVTKTLNASGTLARAALRVRLPGGIQGHIYRVRIYGTGSARLYAWAVQAKQIGTVQATGWQWFRHQLQSVEWRPIPLPIPKTSEGFVAVKLPIPPTSDAFTPVALPIPKTSEAWAPVKLPIPQTADTWSPLKVPIRPTPPEAQWVDLPVDAVE